MLDKLGWIIISSAFVYVIIYHLGKALLKHTV